LSSHEEAAGPEADKIGFDWVCIGFELGLFRRWGQANWLCLALYWLCFRRVREVEHFHKHLY
jgi:hypothetical protein